MPRSTRVELTINVLTVTTTVATQAVAPNTVAIIVPNRKRDVEERQNARKVITPNQLKAFASNIVSVACNCYVTAPTATSTTTFSSVSVSTVVITSIQEVAIQTNTEVISTTSTIVDTVRCTSLFHAASLRASPSQEKARLTFLPANRTLQHNNRRQPRDRNNNRHLHRNPIRNPHRHRLRRSDSSVHASSYRKRMCI